MAARTSRAHVLGPALAGVYLLCNAGQLLDASATFHSERAIWKTIADERPDLSSGPGLEGLDLLSADLDRAAPLLEKAHALAPIDLRWLDGLAILAFRRSDYSRCEALNRRGAQLAGDDVRFAFGRALCLRGLGDRAGAIAETARGLGLQPGHKGLRVLRDELR